MLCLPDRCITLSLSPLDINPFKDCAYSVAHISLPNKLYQFLHGLALPQLPLLAVDQAHIHTPRIAIASVACGGETKMQRRHTTYSLRFIKPYIRLKFHIKPYDNFWRLIYQSHNHLISINLCFALYCYINILLLLDGKVFFFDWRICCRLNPSSMQAMLSVAFGQFSIVLHINFFLTLYCVFKSWTSELWTM